ncbi:MULTISPECIES: PadR family transcriptional regulator [Paenibacillus]|uniref:PadR family transcriptional regulator n=1 Tax=Paenibacillus campinasensis TaxID=66347 RepID=A0A268EZA9_9BACL|nr:MULTISPECIES: PadR family transcriptional regulator [Paenibacillus]MUG65199.1 PadR family transcriptional regulator [Paenibacillus campinasensis]PAD78459.1 PadR family transcriptional regulator [Paenibacillus campinasensis]PAK52461.1 PadR family transcriptional regulator [Paenibacillus sp. 7541]
MSINKELLKGSTVILLLKVLSKKEMYGYELIREIELSSDGVFLMKEGTLYPILHTLEAEEMLESYWRQHDGRKRKYYRITDRGRSMLEEKTKEWVRFRTAVDSVIGEGS